MFYELTATPFALVPRIAEPPMRYRRRGGAGKHSAGAAVPTEQIELRIRARDNGARWKRILDLNARVSGSLRGDARVRWLELEELLHEYWFDVALEHFQTGFESGFARGSRGLDRSSSLPPGDRLRLLAAVLVRVASELEDDDRR